jgi:hypothetical protein
LAGNGIVLPRGGYGDKPGFLAGLDGRGLRHVGEVPKSFRYCGRRPRGRQTRSRADDLVRHSPLFTRQRWRRFRLARATLGEKSFVSNAPAGTPLGVLLRAAFRRWNGEHAIRVSKQEIGFKHYAGRRYVGPMRHQVLCLLLPFVAVQARGLREGTTRRWRWSRGAGA